MLPADRLQLALDIHARSYHLLRWVADAISKGFIPATRAHEYADVTDSAYDWIEEHYQNLPTSARPERSQLRPFANFFATYMMSSFDIVERPGTQRMSRCGCYCRMCAYLVNASHLKTKPLAKREKQRALRLMADRVEQLALESNIDAARELAEEIATGEATRRAAGYSAYGHWLIKRLDGLTDGPSILALWREIAWNKSGSPIPRFELRQADFVAAEQSLVRALELRGG
jgi:hypothetical protein